MIVEEDRYVSPLESTVKVCSCTLVLSFLVLVLVSSCAGKQEQAKFQEGDAVYILPDYREGIVTRAYKNTTRVEYVSNVTGGGSLLDTPRTYEATLFDNYQLRPRTRKKKEQSPADAGAMKSST